MNQNKWENIIDDENEECNSIDDKNFYQTEINQKLRQEKKRTDKKNAN